MKTKLIPTIFLTALMLAGAIQLSAQISGQVINFHFNRYNSAPNGSKVTVHDGENLGTLQWKGWTPGNEYQASAGFGVDVTGTPADGYLPSRLSFYTGGSGLLERMTILENGYLGIGLSNPAELVDINGNVIVRGTRLSLGLGSSFGNGGEAMTHSNTDCTGAPLPDEVLTLNNGGGFPGGVYVEGSGGLHVCSTLDAECLKAENNVVSENGNVVALGGAAIATPCVPGDGDFIAEGANGDFIARHGNFVAEQGSMTARLNITAQTGNISAAAGSVTAQNNVTATTGNVSATAGDVSAGNDVTAGHNVAATNDLSAGQNLSVGVNGTVGSNLQVGNRVSIGTLASLPIGYRLYVEDGILTEKVKVAVNGSADWADYVFAPEYSLRPLEEVESFIHQNRHLPDVPSAEQVVANGVDVAKMDALLLQKIEELTLYMIDLKKENESLKKDVEELKKGNR